MNVLVREKLDELISQFKKEYPDADVVEAKFDDDEVCEDDIDDIKVLKYKFVKDIPELGLVKDKVYTLGYFNPEFDPDCMDEMAEYFDDAMQLKYGRAFELFYDHGDYAADFWTEIDELKYLAKSGEGRIYRQLHGSKYDLAKLEVDHSKNDAITDEEVVWLNPATLLLSPEAIPDEDIDVDSIDMSDVEMPERSGNAANAFADILGKLAASGTEIVGVLPNSSETVDITDMFKPRSKLEEELDELLGPAGYDPDFRM